MPLDPQASALLQLIAEIGAPPIEELTPEGAREAFDIGFAAPATGLTTVEDITIPGPGGPLALRIHRPQAEGPHPVLVFFHGGGWVVGNFGTHDFVCEELADRTPCIVVSVDYRLSPETRFPGPVDDCYAATEWAAGNAAALGARPGPVAVGGDSAGGHLAAAVALRARDKGLPLAVQLLIYPVTDAACDSASYAEFAGSLNLTKLGMLYFWEHFLGPDGDPAHPEASVLRAPDLTGVAPAYVLTAEYDVLRDEGEAYADRLRAAGVRTHAYRFPGQLHGFVTMPPGTFDSTPVVQAMLADVLRSAFAAR